jgi:hypothetical protein
MGSTITTAAFREQEEADGSVPKSGGLSRNVSAMHASHAKVASSK